MHCLMCGVELADDADPMEPFCDHNCWWDYQQDKMNDELEGWRWGE